MAFSCHLFTLPQGLNLQVMKTRWPVWAALWRATSEFSTVSWQAVSSRCACASCHHHDVILYSERANPVREMMKASSVPTAGAIRFNSMAYALRAASCSSSYMARCHHDVKTLTVPHRYQQLVPHLLSVTVDFFCFIVYSSPCCVHGSAQVPIAAAYSPAYLLLRFTV